MRMTWFERKMDRFYKSMFVIFAMVVVLGIISAISKSVNQSKFEKVEIVCGHSENFSRSEIKAACETVLAYYEKNSYGVPLKIWYNEEFSDDYIEKSNNDKKIAVIICVDFDKISNPNYDNFTFTVMNFNNSWKIVSMGIR